MSLIEKSSFTDDNFDTLIFTLTVCVKNLPNKIITNEEFIKKIIKIIKISLNKEENENIYKYILKLNEILLLSQNKEILSNENNELIILSNNIYKGFLNMLSQKNNINIKDFLKSICKIINNKKNEIKFSITKNIIYYIKDKINSMYFNNNDDNNNNNLNNNNLYTKISINEGENILKFLSGIIQFLSFDFIKDLLFELKKLIKFSENLIFLTNSFNCFEICLSIFNLDYDFLIELFNDLSNKNIYLISNNNNNINLDYKNLLIISYVKLLAEILKSLNKINKQKEAIKKFIYFFSVSIELINENDEFVKNSVYNVFQVLIENFFNKNNLNLLFNENKNNDDLLDIDLNKLNINMNNLNNNNNNNEKTDSILFKISKIFIYLLNSKLNDKKYEFNILLQFLEKINLNTDLKYKENIQSINDYVLLSISDNNNSNENNINSNENEYKKIFIGKCFNFIPAENIIQYFPLDLLNYEIEKNDYTENSNVWIISYMSKFLKENVQNLNSFFICFSQVIFDLDYMIKKLNLSINNNNNNEKMEIENIEDEKYEIKENESKYLKEIKINRYKLILTQIYLNLFKFGNYFNNNNNNNYSQIVNQILTNFKSFYNNNNNLFTNENKKNEIIYKFIYKVINESIKNDKNTILILTNEENLFFFQKDLNLLLNNNKLQKSTIQILFNVISLYIKIIPLEKISKTISILLKKFSEILNKNYNFKNMKENNKFLMRIEILNYIILNMNFSINFSLTEKNYNLLIKNNNKSTNEKLIEILLEFFNTFFFNNEIKNKFEKFSYKIFNLFLILLNKITNENFFNETYNEIYNNKNIINSISSKQKIKLFSLLFKKNKNFEISSKILINIATLTKENNIKIRNKSYELISFLTNFYIKNNFDYFFKIMNSLLISENSFIISSGINVLAKIFWELKKIDFNFLYNNFTIVISLLKNNNKEITKSIFLYVRVILYLIKNETNENKKMIVNSIVFNTLNENSDEYLKDFKVKIRNLYKNLILNYGFENIKKMVNEKYFNFIVYVNKNLVKKSDFNVDDDDNNNNNENLFVDNENLIDEEEEFINNQFKKNKKSNNKNKEEKIIEKIESLNIYDDDINEIQKIEKENYKNNNENNKQKKTLDKIEELFKNDNVKLNNFFYVNPFVNNNNNNNKNKENKNKENKIKDVSYDINKGKLIIKDIEKEIELKKLNKKKLNNNLFEGNLLGKKIKNIHKDNLNLLNKNINDDEDDEIDEMNKKTKKRKINNKDNKIIYNNNNNKKISTHYVKYSGNEYKNKKGKGDKIIKGEFEPFAYIQLNPKSLNNKGEKGNIKIFENLMKNNNK